MPNPVVGLFGKSPFKPIQAHMKVVEECVEQTVPLFEALAIGDREAIAGHRERIFDLEQQADDIKNGIRSNLPKSLFMPVDRRDLLDLLNAQDSIADTAQDVVGLLDVRKVVILPPLEPKLMPYVERNLDATRQCRKVINQLDELLEMGFRGQRVDQVLEMIEELGRIETDTDDLGIELTQQLFEHEDDYKALDVVFWYELIQRIGDIADYAEDVGDRLRLLVAR